MRIALHHGSLRFRTNLISTPLSPGNKELLLRSVAIDGWFRMCLRRFLEGKISDFCAGKVADAFAQNQLTVVVDAWLDKVSIELAHHAGSPIVEASEIVGSPPVVQAALRVILRSLIVKAMADFMANHNADAAIVDCIHVIHAKRWLLQYSRGEDDFVKKGIVVSVGCRWSHAPAAAVHWFADLRVVIVNIPLYSRQIVVPIGVAGEFDAAVIFP